ncbi:MAG: ABC transporter permease [Clostridia bacterium]|nr:ABC transporter permease [Clostridia bacterium]
MKNRVFSAKAASAPYVVWSVLFVIAPLVFVAYYAFTGSDGGFTLVNISKFFSAYFDTFIRSLWYGVLSTIICLIIAYPFAYWLAHSGASVQRTCVMLVMLPMWMNFLIRTYAWMNILQDTGIINAALSKLGFDTVHMINTGGAVIFGMVYNFLPYMILPLYSIMTKIDPSMLDAASDLGCSKLQSIIKVVLPQSVPGIVSGITMVFVPSVSTFYISQKLGGGSFDLIGDVIERQFTLSYNYNLGAALSLVLMVLILVSMFFMRRFSDADSDGEVLM